MTISFCEACAEASKSGEKSIKMTRQIKGKSVTLELDTALCVECAEPRDQRRLERHVTRLFMDAYREKHGIITTSRIMTLRKNMNLNQRDFARLLGMGEITVARYEAGHIPSRTNAALIERAQSLEYVMDFYEKNKDAISPKGQDHIKAFITKAKTKDTSFATYNLELTEDALTFLTDIAHEEGLRLSFVHLSRMLYHADMLAYMMGTKTITGLKYYRSELGQIPDHLMSIIERSQHVRLKAEGAAIYVVSQQTHRLLTITPLEKELLNTVYQRYKAFTVEEIIHRVRKEKGYQNTKQGEYFSYEDISELRLG